MALKDFERFPSSDDDIIYQHTKSRITIIFRGVLKILILRFSFYSFIP